MWPDPLEPVEHGAMRRGRNRRDFVTCEWLSSEGRRFEWERLRRPSRFPLQVGGRDLTLFNGKERFSRVAIKQKYVARLCDLRHSINLAPIVFHSQEIGRRRQVAVPEIVM